jgi:hypothetical protein
MNQLLTLLTAFTLVISGCQKNNTNNQLTPTEPEIKKVTFSCVTSGTNQSTRFDVSLVSDSSIVVKVELYETPNSLRWEVKSPTTGNYVMYDHIDDCPKFNDYAMYFFVFTKKDGTKVITDPIHVYM